MSLMGVLKDIQKEENIRNVFDGGSFGLDRQPTLQSLELRVNALERKVERQTTELNRQNKEILRQNQEFSRINKEVNRLNKEISRLNQNDEKHTRDHNQFNQRLRAVENKLDTP